MYEQLYQYLIQQHVLAIPGIGSFLLERIPAQVDFPNRRVEPPAYTIALQPATAPTSRRFLHWLSNTLQISEWEAVVRFNEFAFELKKQLNGGNTIHWKGVGTLSKGLGGEIKFASDTKGLVIEKPVPAEKIVRTNATHKIRVGEQIKSSLEMSRLLSLPGRKISVRRFLILVIILLTSFFIIFYFSQHDSVVSSSANRLKVVPETGGSTYTPVSR